MLTTADEGEFARALAAEADHVFTRRQRDWIWVTIGAGDQRKAIDRLLSAMVANDIDLPTDLVDTALAWISGFRGAGEEPRLRDLIENVIAPEVSP